MYCFCFLTKFPKEIIDIFEGYDYIKVSFEQRQTVKIMNYLYGVKLRDAPRWKKNILNITKKFKLRAQDDQETDCIDLDKVLKMYTDDYFMLRKKN